MKESALPYRDFKAILNASLLHVLILLQNIFLVDAFWNQNLQREKIEGMTISNPRALEYFIKPRRSLLRMSQIYLRNREKTLSI